MLYKVDCTHFRKDLSQHISEYDEWADQFELLPMYFMNFHGQQNIRKVIEVSQTSNNHDSMASHFL